MRGVEERENSVFKIYVFRKLWYVGDLQIYRMVK